MNNRMPDECELVIGVDTHKHVHTAAALDATTGGQRQLIELTNDRAGYSALYDQIPDCPRVWAIEGAGGYGAGLARWLVERGETVVEVERPKRAARRNGAKSDPIDAVRAAREALSRPTATPKHGQVRAALAVRLSARRSAVEASADTQRQLLALVVTAPPTLHDRLAKLRTRELIVRCERLRSHPTHDIEMAETIVVLRRLARRIRDLEAEAAEHETALRRLVADWRPDLLEVQGVGPIVAATLLCAWSHPAGSTPRPRSPSSPAQHPSPHLPGRPPATGSPDPVTDSSTGPCTPSCSPDCATTTAHAPTPNDDVPRARPTARSNAASSATSPDSSTGNSRPDHHPPLLDNHRSVRSMARDHPRTNTGWSDPISPIRSRGRNRYRSRRVDPLAVVNSAAVSVGH